MPQKLKAHIFICTNERPPGSPRGCCKEKNSDNLIQQFKEGLARAGVRGEVRAQRAGCLDVCELGPAVVVYPDNIWYGKVQSEDIAEIVSSHIINKVPVKRLLIPGK
jgi:(2Fe-2S) ferredoxin